ncbi:HesA/MoeB/ThiF family protein [Pseudodesulfovibrio sp.]|uniref:HesA/MoeB/ThiF family protein n=1 Tax=unclassified Pseudodesulfovibrio TaxID=2661612 RepID=UPI003AFFFF8E
MDNGIIPERYLRNRRAISISEQIKLLQSRVGMVGLGGLGGSLLDQLLRLGIGTLRAADGDTFESSNLNRQALATVETLGVSKAEAAKLRAQEINPSVAMETIPTFLTASSLPSFMKGCTLAVDALGGLVFRPQVTQAAANEGIPLVTGALAGWVGYVGVVQPGGVSPSEVMGTNESADKNLGCPAPAVNFVASLMAAEIVRILSEKSSPLEGKMLIIDMKTLTFEQVSL